MKVPNTEAYSDLLRAEIRKHTGREVRLVFSDDVAAWARENCPDLHGNPIAAAFHWGPEQQWGIVLRRSLSSSAIDSVISGIDLRVGRGDQLNAPVIFLRHLVLHELAHLVNDWGQSREDDCDLWAFDRL